jgi:thiol-disulfide isomerase/thioredoxin
VKVENFTVYDINGKRHLFYDLFRGLPKDGVVILNFTSIHCRPCRKEIPELVSIARTAGNRVGLICIYLEHGVQVSENASSLGVADRAYVDLFGNIKRKFDIKRVPLTFIIGRDYTIQSRIDGYSAENIKKIEHLVSLQ